MIESDNLSLEKRKLENIDLKISKIKASILNKVEAINEYVEKKLIKKGRK